VTKDLKAARNDLSFLTLAFEVVNERPDWPAVRVLVDGTDPFATAAPDWRGFDPQSMLGPDSPLLPVDGGRRVAVYTCSCGEAGCGVIAPMIVPSPDGRRVSWVDPRDYTGVYIRRPLEASVALHEGKPWELPDLHFDREQYVAEVRRASEDRSWETTRRQTARLLYELLKPEELVLPPGLPFNWASPSWSVDGVTLMFQRLVSAPEHGIRQQMLKLESTLDDPSAAAADMAARLLAAPVDEWVERFGWNPAS
jgi:hypothetical protein